MRCIAELILESDLCLPDDAPPIVLEDASAGFHLTLSNAPDISEAGPDLLAILVFDSENLDTAREAILDLIADILSCLSFATNRNFKFKDLRRIIDWTPGLVEREASIFAQQAYWHIKEPALNSDFVDSAGRLFAMRSGQEQRTAMRWYRLALGEGQLEQQFSHFWFALEIASQFKKSRERVPSKCPVCRSDLYCEKCRVHPTHRRYESEAIQNMIQRVHPKNADEVFDTLQKIRHTVMHGDRISSVIESLPCDEKQALNKLGLVTWRAIQTMFDKPDPKEGRTMHFGYVEDLTRRTIVGSARISAKQKGDPNDPKLADFPDVQFSIQSGRDLATDKGEQ